MKIRFKLSFWLIIIMSVVVMGIAVLLLQQVSGISYYLNIRSLEHLTSQRAEFWKGQEDSYLRMLHTLANVMSDYETIKAEERRDHYDNLLRSALEAEPQMAALYTVWKPNAIDNMDSRYIGRTGSSPTGVYAMSYIRENGKMAGHTSGDINNIIAHIIGPNAHKERVENPTLLKIKGKNTLIIKMMVPVINRRTNEVVGGLGCFLVIDPIQHIIENTMKTNNEIAMIAMYSGNGTILAHYIPERVGKRMLDVDVELGDTRMAMFRAMQNGKTYIDTVYNPKLKENIIYITKPFQIGNSGHNWSMLIGISESYVLKDVKAMTGFTFMLAVISIFVMAVIIFVTLGIITKPIVRVTDVLRDISEGEGNLMQFLPENGNDEIADMSRYFNLTLKKIKNLIIVIKQQSAILSDTGAELSCNMMQTAAVITQITTNLENIENKLIYQNSQAAQAAAILVNKDISAEINEVAAGTDQINTTVSRVNEISEKNKKNIELLVRGASMFKVA